MKAYYKTSEFWGALITNVVGVAMLMGYVNTEEGEELGNALKAIAGAVLSLASTIGYIHERTSLKKAHVTAISQAAYNGPGTMAEVRASIQKSGV